MTLSGIEPSRLSGRFQQLFLATPRLIIVDLGDAGSWNLCRAAARNNDRSTPTRAADASWLRPWFKNQCHPANSLEIIAYSFAATISYGPGSWAFPDDWRRTSEDDSLSLRPKIRGFEVRGDLLRSLRQARGWTQEEAAHRAGVSDKLIRKAEGGGRIDGRSLTTLAAAFTTTERPITEQELLAAERRIIASPDAEGTDNHALVRTWFQEIWTRGRLELIDELASESIIFFCELGVLRTREELRQRIRVIRESFGDFNVTVDALAFQANSLSCRWSVDLANSGLHHRTTGSSLFGTTSMWIESNKVREACEYLGPRPTFSELHRRAALAGAETAWRVYH
jgi:transcriptional regulator with XRE-family HTH domain